MVWIGISILSISVKCPDQKPYPKHAKNLSKTYHWLRLSENNWYCQLRETSPGTARGSESCVCCIQKTKRREKVKQPIGKLGLSECSLLFNIQHIEKLLTKHDSLWAADHADTKRRVSHHEFHRWSRNENRINQQMPQQKIGPPNWIRSSVQREADSDWFAPTSEEWPRQSMLSKLACLTTG